MRDRYPIIQYNYFSFKRTIYSEDKNPPIATLVLVITNSMVALYSIAEPTINYMLNASSQTKKIGGISFVMSFYVGRSLRRTVFRRKINQENQKR